MAQAIYEPFQSGFTVGHGTETALIRVFNDLLLATDAGDLVILTLLDLHAAFTQLTILFCSIMLNIM